jgi:hypothetical protein
MGGDRQSDGVRAKPQTRAADWILNPIGFFGRSNLFQMTFVEPDHLKNNTSSFYSWL